MYSENKVFALEFTFGVALLTEQLLFVSHCAMIYEAEKSFLFLEIYFALQRRKAVENI